MCSGRVDMEFILRAFINGVDGVFIGGCRLGECNYTTHGNYHTLNMVLLFKKIMEHIGLNPDRLRIEFMSSGEGNLFTEVVDDFTDQVRELGPLGSSEGLDRTELTSRLKEVGKLIPYIKLVKMEKMGQPPVPDEYDQLYTAEEINSLFEDVVSYYIDPEKCQACQICARKCPVEAIVGGKNQIHVIDQDLCIKCGTCLEACPDRFDAVLEIKGEPAPPPIPPEQRTLARKEKEKRA